MSDLESLRDAVETLRGNRASYWNRPGSREAHEQDGEDRAYAKVLGMIDGRIEHGNRNSATQPEGPGQRAVQLDQETTG